MIITMRFEVLKAVKKLLVFVWVATPCGLVAGYLCDGPQGIGTEKANIKFDDNIKITIIIKTGK
jgi:hypothetical protein